MIALLNKHEYFCRSLHFNIYINFWRWNGIKDGMKKVLNGIHIDSDDESRKGEI